MYTSEQQSERLTRHTHTNGRIVIGEVKRDRWSRYFVVNVDDRAIVLAGVEKQFKSFADAERAAFELMAKIDAAAPKRTEDQQKLLHSIFDARLHQDKTIEIEIGAHKFSISHYLVNRQCYWFEPVPTIKIMMDGRRISVESALEALK